MRFLNNATTHASKTSEDRMPLLDEVRMETLMPKKCVCQEVGDLLLQYMCSLIGADFYDSSHLVNKGKDPWPSVKAYRKPEDPRFLVFSTQAAASISLFVKDNNEKSIKKWVDKTSKVLRTYGGSSWAVPHDNHYTSVTMRLDASTPSQHVMRCTQADSLTRGGNCPRIDDGLRRGFEEICEKLQAELSFEKGPHGPTQRDPDCLFFAILSQMARATVTGVPLPTDDASCQMHAALLRFYAHTLAVQNWIECEFITVDMNAIFVQWLASASKESSEVQVTSENSVASEASRSVTLSEGTAISEKTAAVFVKAARECPFDKEVYRHMLLNIDRKCAKSAVDLNRFRTHVGSKNLPNKFLKDAKSRETFVEQFVTYISHLLISSCLALGRALLTVVTGGTCRRRRERRKLVHDWAQCILCSTRTKPLT
jgi:hypothetical protein